MAKADPYTDPKTGCPYNILGITNRAELVAAEYNYSIWRAHQLSRRPLPGNFDLAHLQAIHKYLFQDVYTWAGKLKTVENSVRAPFCKPEHIQSEARRIFGQLARADYYRGLPREQFIDQAAQLYAD